MPEPNVIRFDCPQCGKALAVRAEHAGKTTRCSQCNELLRVPGQPIAPAVAAPAQAEVQTQTGRGWLMFAVASIAFAAGGLLMMGVALVQGPQASADSNGAHTEGIVHDRIEAREFILRDSQGRIRAAITMDRWKTNGSLRPEPLLEEPSVVLYFADGGQAAHISLGVVDDQHEFAHMELWDSAFRSHLRAGLFTNGEPFIRMDAGDAAYALPDEPWSVLRLKRKAGVP